MEDDTFTTGREETLASRLRLMVKLAPGISDATAGSLAARLSASGLRISRREVQGHLDGALVPTDAERAAYAYICQWHADTSMLADDPAVYLLPLIQAEILLSIRLIGMPHSRGQSEFQALERMSVDELRRYRGHLFSRGRPHLFAA